MTLQDRNSQKILYYVILPALFALYCIAKVFYLPHCFAFDSNDEANHTFPNLYAAFNLLRAGYLPLMNLSNNFGTPLMGDCLTFPFSVFSLSYHFLTGPEASTLNRALVIFLTLTVSTCYYRRYFSLPVASLCAFLLVLTPGAFWNMAHHHYQGTVLFTVLLLFFQERFARELRRRDMFFFYAAAAGLVISVSINLVVYAFLFVLANALLFAEKRGRVFFASVSLLSAAVLLYLPEFYILKHQFAAGQRAAEVYGAPMPFKEFLLSVLGGAKITFVQQYWHYVSWPLIWVVLMGLTGLKADTPARRLQIRSILLGVLPLGFVLFALADVGFYSALPFLKSTDITRILWISNIFLLLPAGRALQVLSEKKIPPGRFAGFAFLYAAYLLIMQVVFGWQTIPWQYSLSVFLVFFAAAALILCWKKNARHGFAFALILIGFFLTRLPVFYLILGQGHSRECRVAYSHWYSNGQDAFYPEPGALQFVEPLSRISHEEETYWGRDLRLVYHDLFGVQARAPLIHAGMYAYLLQEQLVQRQEWLANYYLSRPWRPERMQELGVRYLIARETEEQVRQSGWKLIGRRGPVALIENPLPASVFYLEDSNGKRRPLSAKEHAVFSGNGFGVLLPPLESTQELVAAFIDRPGWQASVDNQKRTVRHLRNQFMRVTVNPGDQKVRFDYRPVEWSHVIICAAASLLLSLMTGFWAGRKKD